MNKIIFIGTQEFSVCPLVGLNDNENIDVKLVITGEDKIRSRNKFESTPVKKKALELGLDIYETNNLNSSESLNKIDEIDPDYIVVIAFGQIIGKRLLEKYKDRIINVHSSLLPKYRGAAPMQWAILNKDEKAGVCTMLIERKMDTGDILDCREIELTPDTDINQLHDTLSKLSSELIVDTILNYQDRFSNRIKQDEQKASYSEKINKEMGYISFEEKAEDIKAKILAFSTWPSTYVNYEDKKMKIHKIDIIEKYTENIPGEVFRVDDEGIFVNCLDKCIIIKELQMPGKKKVGIKTFLNGNSINKNTIFK